MGKYSCCCALLVGLILFGGGQARAFPTMPAIKKVESDVRNATIVARRCKENESNIVSPCCGDHPPPYSN